MKITVGDQELLATFADNSSAEEFRELLAQGPLTIEMEDYGGFEKVGPLGTTLTRNDTQITTEPGDVILYQGNQITIYYGTNSWSFTRLARIDDPSGLQEVLGEGAVSVTFSLE
nr:cyclophilin-like fold protein [uncultured Oscillibacter sp.]